MKYTDRLDVNDAEMAMANEIVAKKDNDGDSMAKVFDIQLVVEAYDEDLLMIYKIVDFSNVDDSHLFCSYIDCDCHNHFVVMAIVMLIVDRDFGEVVLIVRNLNLRLLLHFH